MELKLKRAYSDDKHTIGVMTMNGKFAGFTLEDAVREKKIAGITCIPEGKYRIALRTELSPMTQKYRDSHPFFDWHLMLVDVPNYENVYIHIGNSHRDTEGCILIGDQLANPLKTALPLQLSGNAFKDFYKSVRPVVESEPVWITVSS